MKSHAIGRHEAPDAEEVGPQRIRIDVDGGSIQMARSEDLARALEFYFKIMEASLWTAMAVWDGRKGGMQTPDGDGPHFVVYDPSVPFEPKEWRATPSAFFVNLRPGEPARPFDLYLGDSGRIQGAISFPAHTFIAARWIDRNVLQFVSELAVK